MVWGLGGDEMGGRGWVAMVGSDGQTQRDLRRENGIY